MGRQENGTKNLTDYSAKLKEHVGVRIVLMCGGSESLFSSHQNKSEESGRSSI